MRYVVTGAAGFIGSHLVERLLAGGNDVRAIDCFTDYYDPALKRENAAAFPVEQVDLTVDRLDFGGCDGVFHLAGQPGVRSFGDVFPLYVLRNEVASQRVFEAAAAAGARVAFSSSSSVYGDAASYPTAETAEPRPRSPYGITKLACEHLARAYGADFGLECVVLRYFTVYGPRQRPDMFMARVIRALLEDRAFTLYGDGRQSRSFTYVADVVQATIDAMQRASGGAVYNVGGGQEATVNEAIDALQRIAGRALAVTRAPPVPGDVPRTKADTSRIRDDLGWEPVVSLEDGLRAHWAWAARSRAADHV